jgi:hypothetical protein
MLQLDVVAQAERPAAFAEEALELLPGRHGGRAAVPRDDDRAARVGVLAAGRQRLAAQPAAQEAGHEGVAGAEHVEDLDRKPSADHAIVETVGNLAREGRASLGPALADQQGVGLFPYFAQGRDGVGRSAEDVHLFLSADDEIAQRQHLLQPRGDSRVGDEAVLAPSRPVRPHSTGR